MSLTPQNTPIDKASVTFLFYSWGSGEQEDSRQDTPSWRRFPPHPHRLRAATTPPSQFPHRMSHGRTTSLYPFPAYNRSLPPHCKTQSTGSAWGHSRGPHPLILIHLALQPHRNSLGSNPTCSFPLCAFAGSHICLSL